ncbi:metallophosphoesterase [Frigoriglobus tundricola]|uniref:Calcineurin-like phosphoesterase domain-containing protein n=1 Tax=Frigoriglobus tundricola TaxID=2774151 RepID=A0A6M5Z5C4_9BACT|nr:metallophosphoesterase [Frigoriglobus tundricola]QJX00644.1 hypothetical protein FTUN_8276 [Frigoriglobus tundricola]
MKRALASVFIGLGAGAGYSRFIERHAVEVVPVPIDLGLTTPLTVAVLSDIHFDPLYEIDYLEEVVARNNQLSPDLIIHTGDFLSQSAERLSDLLAVLAKGRAGVGSFAVLGNHDHYIGADAITAGLMASGISVLRNRSVPLPGQKDCYLTGLESFWAGAPNLTPIESSPPHARHILLAHEPDSFDLLTDARIALQVSGHTHGGQVRLPLVGAICLPSWGKKYEAGLYARGEQRLYVNRGIGTVKRHFRFNCRPEITLLALT